MEKEIWKSIEGYEGLYEVSSIGRVKSLNYKRTRESRVLKPKQNRDGYLFIILYKKGKRKNELIHRLVSKAFIPNNEPLMKTEVNHRNENKSDNRVDNLEWVTSKENSNYGTRNERISKAQVGVYNKKSSKIVIQYSLCHKFIKQFPSAHEVERDLGFNRGNISACCRGVRNTAYGYIWRYKMMKYEVEITD